ncbi:MAG: LytTR family DNA-binding domain-containing protein [Bacilli bacterium]
MYNIAKVEDDEKDKIKLSLFLQKYKEEKGIEINVSVFSDAETFLTEYRASFNLVFLDIELPKKNGMDAAKELRKKDKLVQIVFVTNMTQFAIKGYEVNAIDYILKPIEYFSFAMKVERALNCVDFNNDSKITISKYGGIERISILNLLYVEVTGHYLTYHTDCGDVIARGKISALEDELKSKNFCRCNNSYLVNLRFVNSVHGYNVRVGNVSLKMSRTKQKEFMNTLAVFLGGGK